MTREEHKQIGEKFSSLKSLEKTFDMFKKIKNEGIKGVGIYLNGHNTTFVLDEQSYNVVLNMIDARYKRKIDKLKIELGAR